MRQGADGTESISAAVQDLDGENKPTLNVGLMHDKLGVEIEYQEHVDVFAAAKYRAKLPKSEEAEAPTP